MCLIVHNPFGNKLNKKLISVAYDNNPHGFGLLWLDDNNELSELKDISNFDTLWTILKYLDGHSYSLHLRWKTRGNISVDQCHPFRILDKEKHGTDLYLMHNGTIFGLDDDEKSDSQLFAEILTEMYEKNFVDKDLTHFFNFIESGKETFGTFNKFLFLTPTKSKIFNRAGGITNEDVWYSNYYSFVKDFRKKQTTAGPEEVKSVYNNFVRKRYGR